MSITNHYFIHEPCVALQSNIEGAALLCHNFKCQIRKSWKITKKLTAIWSAINNILVTLWEHFVLERRCPIIIWALLWPKEQQFVIVYTANQKYNVVKIFLIILHHNSKILQFQKLWFSCSSRLPLSFNSPVVLIFTLVAKLLLCAWTVYTKDHSSPLTSRVCQTYWAVTGVTGYDPYWQSCSWYLQLSHFNIALIWPFYSKSK